MKYRHLLPFMDREELKKVAEEIISGEIQNVKLVSLYPFLDRDDLHDIVDLLIEKKDAENLRKAIPFISRTKVLDIYQASEKGDLPDFDATWCLPFLDSDKIKDIFRTFIKKQRPESTTDEDDE